MIDEFQSLVYWRGGNELDQLPAQGLPRFVSILGLLEGGNE